MYWQANDIKGTIYIVCMWAYPLPAGSALAVLGAALQQRQPSRQREQLSSP